MCSWKSRIFHEIAAQTGNAEGQLSIFKLFFNLQMSSIYRGHIIHSIFLEAIARDFSIPLPPVLFFFFFCLEAFWGRVV